MNAEPRMPTMRTTCRLCSRFLNSAGCRFSVRASSANGAVGCVLYTPTTRCSASSGEAARRSNSWRWALQAVSRTCGSSLEVNLQADEEARHHVVVAHGGDQLDHLPRA